MNPLHFVLFQAFVSHYSSMLHPSHGLMMRAKHALSLGYGRRRRTMTQTVPELRRQVELCREVLEATERLEAPIATRIGERALRGKLHFAPHKERGPTSALARATHLSEMKGMGWGRKPLFRSCCRRSRRAPFCRRGRSHFSPSLPPPLISSLSLSL